MLEAITAVDRSPPRRRCCWRPLGELVVERSGVLNLGVEGMMVMGAACGFAAACLTGSPWLGALAGDRSPARMLALLFALLTLGLAANQVATGLALTILGLGLSGLIGAGFVGQRGHAGAASVRARPSPTCRSSAASCSARTRSSTSRSRWSAGVGWFLYRTRAGLTLRAIGDNHGLRACARLSGHAGAAARGRCSAAPARGSPAPTCRSSTRRSGSPA